MSNLPQKFTNVSIDTKANVYFDGKVVSHSFYDQQGQKKTLGLIFPGTYKFNTQGPERMIITVGTCTVLQANDAPTLYKAEGSFNVPANSAFTIIVENGICEYLCEFL